MSELLLPLGSEDLNFKKKKSNIDFSKSEKLYKEVKNEEIQTPKTLDDLTSENVFTTQLTVDVAIDLNLPVVSTADKLSRRIFVQEYSKYKDINDGIQKIRYGIGIRWIVDIKIIDAQAQTSSLPLVSASAQVGFANASAQFQVLGISSASITALIPAPKSLNVDTYVDMTIAFKGIKDLINDATTKIEPQILAVLGEVKENKYNDYEEALAISWALTRIADKDNLSEALRNDRGEIFNEVVKSIYIDIAKNSELNKDPDVAAVRKSEEILKDFKLKD